MYILLYYSWLNKVKIVNQMHQLFVMTKLVVINLQEMLPVKTIHTT